jgi:hypothetical protein
MLNFLIYIAKTLTNLKTFIKLPLLVKKQTNLFLKELILTKN